LLPLEAIPGLNGFVLFFALPCLLYRFGASTPIAQLLDVTVIATWTVCAVVMVAFAVAVSLNERIRWNDAAFGALVAAFPNTGFMGVPLLVALLGPAAAGPIIGTMLVDMVITTSLCIALSRLDVQPGSGGDSPVRQAALKALKGVLANPMPWAILLGALASTVGFVLPSPIGKTVGLLADAASPVALFTIGAVLARSQMVTRHTEDLGVPTDAASLAADTAVFMSATDAAAHGYAAPPRAIAWRDDVPVALFKLLLHPLLVLLVGGSLTAMGLPLERSALLVMVLAAALPSASNVSLLAERFGADNGRIARIILVSTAAAFFTFSGAVALLRPAG
jgi:predicted permease